MAVCNSDWTGPQGESRHNVGQVHNFGWTWSCDGSFQKTSSPSEGIMEVIGGIRVELAVAVLIAGILTAQSIVPLHGAYVCSVEVKPFKILVHPAVIRLTVAGWNPRDYSLLGYGYHLVSISL